MENRFGFKEFVICVLLVGVIVVLYLQMRQIDHYKDDLDTMKESLSVLTSRQAEMNREMAGLSALIESGAVQASTNGGSADGPPAARLGDPFQRVKEAEDLPGFQRGGTYREAFGVSPPMLTPLLSSDVYASIMQSRVLEPLAIQDPQTLEYRPLIARSWTLHPEDLRIVFNIRRGVTFSDGVACTANDIEFAFNWIMNPKVAAPRTRAYYSRIKSVTAIDDSTLEVVFSDPYFEWFDLAAGLTPLAEHFYGKYTPEDFNKHPGLLLGTGPYRLENPEGWRPNSPLVLVRNERYWGVPGTFDRVEYKVISNEAQELTAFRNGEIDIFGATPEQYTSLLDDQAFMADSQSFDLEHLRQGYLYIAWNQQRGGKDTIFKDRRVRQAMTMLINRQGICDDIYLGYAWPATGPFHRLGQQADPAIKAWPHDIDRAMDLLKSAGCKRNDRGELLKPDGSMFEVSLIYPSGSDIYQRVVFRVKDDLAKAGINLKPDPKEWANLIKAMDTRDFDAITLGWSSGIETDIYQMFHSSQIADNADNYMSYQSAELDAAIEAARSQLDPDKRMPLWRKCHRILHEDQPYTFMFRRKSLFFIDNRIRNVKVTDVGLNFVSTWSQPWPWFVGKEAEPADR